MVLVQQITNDLSNFLPANIPAIRYPSQAIHRMGLLITVIIAAGYSYIYVYNYTN